MSDNPGIPDECYTVHCPGLGDVLDANAKSLSNRVFPYIIVAAMVVGMIISCFFWPWLFGV